MLNAVSTTLATFGVSTDRWLTKNSTSSLAASHSIIAGTITRALAKANLLLSLSEANTPFLSTEAITGASAKAIAMSTPGTTNSVRPSWISRVQINSSSSRRGRSGAEVPSARRALVRSPCDTRRINVSIPPTSSTLPTSAEKVAAADTFSSTICCSGVICWITS